MNLNVFRLPLATFLTSLSIFLGNGAEAQPASSDSGLPPQIVVSDPNFIGTGSSLSRLSLPGGRPSFLSGRSYFGTIPYVGTPSHLGSLPYVGSLPNLGSVPYAGSVPYVSSIPYAGSIPSIGSIPYAGSIPYVGSLPGLGSLPYVGGYLPHGGSFLGLPYNYSRNWYASPFSAYSRPYGLPGGIPSSGRLSSTRVIQTAPSKASGNYYSSSTPDPGASGSYYSSSTTRDDYAYYSSRPKPKSPNNTSDSYWGASGSPFPKDLKSTPWAP
ncbi:MAG TPA: hypothetical protein PKE54_13150 [Candidatus Obscuribacter sp.]|nr:hypothetical protein [Candidatus Obscuribacter sp.]